MNHTLSRLPSPALAGVIREKTELAAIAEIRNCLFDGADMIDLHLSCLERTDVESLQKVIRSSRLPVLALNYNRTCEWQNAGYEEPERVESLLRAVDAGAAGIDMQGYTFHSPSKTDFCGEDRYSFTKGNPREIVTDPDIIARQCALIEQVHERGAEVLLSCHPGVVMDHTQVVELALFLEQRGPDIIKIVTPAKTEADLAESMRTMIALKQEVRTPVAYHANGAAGRFSRIMNPALGGQIAFCISRYTESSTMGQIDLRTARAAIDSLRKLM